MAPFRPSLQRIDYVIWSIIAATSAIILAMSLLGPFHVEWASYPKAAMACVALCAAGWFYRTVRNDPLPADALISTAQIAAFAAVAAPLSYIAASTGLPLWDATYAAWDRGLGFDWSALLVTMNAYPELHRIFAVAYASFFVQTTAVVVALAIANQPARLRIFILGFMFATFVTIAISALMPAQGVWGYLHLTARDYPAIMPSTREQHLAVFHGLRAGTFRSLVADGAEGIITFPSLHAALGLLFIFALWPVRYLRWPAIVLNILMIASTPVDGGHYFCDALAGLAIAILCWGLARRIVRAYLSDETILLVPNIAGPSLVPDSALGLASDSRIAVRSPDCDHEPADNRADMARSH